MFAGINKRMQKEISALASPMRKKLRLLLLLSVNMLHGLEDRSWHHCPPPKRCGFQNRNIMNLVPELFTTSVFKSTIDRSIVVLIDILKVH